MILKIDKQLKFANRVIRKIKRPINLDLDISAVNDLTGKQFIQFRNSFLGLLSEIRSKNISLNYNSLLMQSIHYNALLIGPKTLNIKISGICNYKCRFCGAHNPVLELRTMSNLKNFMPFTDIKQIIDDAYSLGTEDIQISGSGEPLLHPQILEIISYIAKKGLKITIFTNAATSNVVAKILKLPSSYNLCFIVNIAAASPEKHAIIHHCDPLCFNETLDAIARLNKRFRLICSYVITKNTFADIIPFIRLIHQLGVRQLWLRMLTVNNKSYKILACSEMQQKTLLNNLAGIKNLCKSLGINVDLSSLHGFFLQKNKKIKISRCYIGWQYAFVDLNGYVFYCCKNHKPLGRVVRGNFRKAFLSSAYLNSVIDAKNGIGLNSLDRNKCGQCISVVKNARMDTQNICSK